MNDQQKRFQRYQQCSNQHCYAHQDTTDATVDDWTGYGAPPAPPDDVDLFSYELSAYSATVGYHSDGIQRVSPAFSDEQLASYRRKGR
jgi:hypothetical protein